MPSQYIYATASPEAALFFAVTGSGPGFAGAYGKPPSPPKRVVVQIDLDAFKGEILDMSSAAGCEQYALKKDSQAWDMAFDHKMVMLVGYVQPHLVTKVFDLQRNPMPGLNNPNRLANSAITFQAFRATLPQEAKAVLSRDWIENCVLQENRMRQ